MSLFRLTYCSRQQPGLRLSDMTQILAKAEVNNQRLGITGMLCFGHGYFLQTIEGERLALGKLFTKICQDERHSDVEIIEFAEVGQRTFPDWTMKCLDVDVTNPNVRPLVKRFSGTPEFQPQLMNPGQCLGFLVGMSRV